MKFDTLKASLATARVDCVVVGLFDDGSTTVRGYVEFCRRFGANGPLCKDHQSAGRGDQSGEIKI